MGGQAKVRLPHSYPPFLKNDEVKVAPRKFHLNYTPVGFECVTTELGIAGRLMGDSDKINYYYEEQKGSHVCGATVLALPLCRLLYRRQAGRQRKA